ncbi:hypothetical protein GOQ27_12990 [Clostridium sp. D2Q-11]|uniref:Uncharacterized protein n=1 Tax=Anaeromonas frigoriresistens TaxID=2683708 RepID=A0A942UWI8_9FIRM|nr:hypothetical protein [Anaeromonas frigoriresistens]MBS4539385.1 hypothetical protein [Anaeromonas frigoriresistens]
MKTLEDLKKMKNTPCPPFSDAYTFLIMKLEDNIIGKLNGEKRNEALLSEYDEASKTQILIDLEYQLEKNKF